jgi:DNA-binding beta-propeller fold protein YncE
VAALLLITVGPAAARQELRVYVPNQMGASVSVLDGAGRALETVDLERLGFSAHAMPHQVVAEADGSAWYVTLAGDGFVLKFDRANRLVAKTAVAEPGMIVLDAERELLYVSRALGSANPPRSLAVLRASSLELLDEPDIFVPRPHALAVDTASGRVYAGSLSTNEIAMLDFASGEVTVTNVAGPPRAFVGLAVSPDGRTLVATTQLTAELLAFAATGGELEQRAAVGVESLPYDVTFSPDGASVWFPNQRAGAVTRVDARTWQVAAVIRSPAFQEPHGVVLSPDGTTVYVSSHGRTLGAHGDAHAAAGHDMSSPRANGTLVVLDAVTGEVRQATEVGPYAAALGLARFR